MERLHDTDEAVVLTVQELNWLLDGFELWRNHPHQVLTRRSAVPKTHHTAILESHLAYMAQLLRCAVAKLANH